MLFCQNSDVPEIHGNLDKKCPHAFVIEIQVSQSIVSARDTKLYVVRDCV